MTDHDFAIVEDDAPDRCQAVTSRDQCRMRAIEGTIYCRMHGGGAARAIQVKKDQRKYKLAKWQERADHFADDDEIKNITDEIGILRMTLEGVLVACKSETDLLLYSPKIADLVAKIEKLVVTCAKLEAAAGVTLTRKAVATLASQIVDIVARNVTDPDAVARIAQEIGEAIANIKGDDSDL